MDEMSLVQRSVVIRINSKVIEDGGKGGVSSKEINMNITWTIKDKK